MLDAAAKRKRLKQRFSEPGLIVAPGVYDMISAKFADSMGFDAIYMTGYGAVASYLGLPDAGLATYTEMLNRAGTIAQGCKTPLIADADTGYGGLLNVAHTVKGYETAGVAGIQIEDQEFPKKCGHTPGRRVVPAKDMVNKIKVACEARRHDDFLIVARTDSRTSMGLNEALDRAHAYAEAGADVLFIEAPETTEEMVTIGKSFKKPLLINVVEGGKTPVHSRAELEKMGFKIAIHPATAFLAVGQVLDQVYGALLTEGSSQSVIKQLYDFKKFSVLMGFEDIWEFDRKHADW